MDPVGLYKKNPYLSNIDMDINLILFGDLINYAQLSFNPLWMPNSYVSMSTLYV
jgi:hypothetical protein